MRRLVEALNACWLPRFPGHAPVTLADFKRDIRERQVWCSSCMIAFDGADPIGVLIGAKRPHATLIDMIAVRPDKMRQGHGRHMIESLKSKLEILGPKRIVAEIPETQHRAMAFFEACGFARDATFTDWALEDAAPLAGVSHVGGDAGRFVVPVSVADLVANRLLEAHPDASWAREPMTLLARAERLSGFGLATVDRIEAFVLYRRPADGGPGASIDALRPASIADEDGTRRLLGAVLDATGPPLAISRLADGEIPAPWLRSWEFKSSGTTVRHRVTAGDD